MRKIDIIFQVEKIDQLKTICQTLEISDIIFSEVKLFNPDLLITKRYRGAEYQMSQLTKLKAEIIVEDNCEDKVFLQLEEILEKEKGDSIVSYIVERVR